MDMKNYEAAVKDVKLAVENGVPKEKEKKLKLRLVNALQALNKEEEALDHLERISQGDDKDLIVLKETY